MTGVHLSEIHEETYAHVSDARLIGIVLNFAFNEAGLTGNEHIDAACQALQKEKISISYPVDGGTPYRSQNTELQQINAPDAMRFALSGAFEKAGIRDMDATRKFCHALSGRRVAVHIPGPAHEL